MGRRLRGIITGRRPSSPREAAALPLACRQSFLRFFALSGRLFHPLLRKWPPNRSVTLFWGEHRGRQRNLSVPLAAPNFLLRLAWSWRVEGSYWNTPAVRRLSPIPAHEDVSADSNVFPHLVDRCRVGAACDGFGSDGEEGIAASSQLGITAARENCRDRRNASAGELAHSFD